VTGSYVMSCNRNLQTSNAPLKSQALGTSLFTSVASNQRGCPKNHVIICKAPLAESYSEALLMAGSRPTREGTWAEAPSTCVVWCVNALWSNKGETKNS